MTKEEKENKNQGKTQPNFFQRLGERIRRYFAETIGELRKVNWPTRREAWYLTIIVLVVVGIMSIILGSFDWVYSELFEWILTLPV